jgi:hypothetical protein
VSQEEVKRGRFAAGYNIVGFLYGFVTRGLRETIRYFSAEKLRKSLARRIGMTALPGATP